jgi:hypothetical protein
MTTVISLYGKSFTIGFGEAEDTRRKNFFSRGLGSLTPQERALLVSLGVDEELENSLKPYLAEFFSTLDQCSADPNLILSKDCETAYFVIWSAFFHNRKEVERRLKDNRSKYGAVGEEELAQDMAIIDGLKAKPARSAKGKGKSPIDALFTLMFVEPETTPVPGDTFSRLFTLMFVEEGAT